MYERYFTYHRDPDIRASDADRDATADRLRKHHTDGRIDPEEFQERIDRCYNAKTVGELDELVSDLPRERDPRSARRLYWRLWPIPLVPVLAAILVVSVATWHHAGFGLLWLIPVFFLIRMCIWRRYRRWETL
jgi:Flp pilus assembly protein TadB